VRGRGRTRSDAIPHKSQRKANFSPMAKAGSKGELTALASLPPLADQPSPDSVVTASTSQQTALQSQGKPSFLQAVADWLADWRTVSREPAGLKLHSKFIAAGASLTLQYGQAKEFFAGLEGLVGSPSSDVMAAMVRDHASDEPFEAWNAEQPRVTTPRAEWIYVVEGTAGKPVPQVAGATFEGRERHPSHDTDCTGGRAGWKLKDFAAQPQIAKAGLMLTEVAGIRLYTGPMYVHYNNTLRKQVFGEFTTTLHAINSGIVKLSKLTKATTVYRGVDRLLPDEFWKASEDGVMGGVERAFMSTSVDRKVALGYMNQSKQTVKILFQIRMGMIDRGADVSCLSQFPAEREILFAPLTGLEISAVPRDEEGVLVIELRLSCNLHDQTLEQVVDKMLTSHLALIDVMVDNLRLGVPGLPALVLEPLVQAKAKAKALKEADHTWFNQPQRYMEATQVALNANDACFAKLATVEAWATVSDEDGAIVAARMRTAAKKCANEHRPREAAALLAMAAERAGVPQEHQDKVAHLLSYSRKSVADLQPALEAAGLLLGTCGSEGMWKPTLVELCARSGDRHTVARLAQLYDHQPSSLWHIQPLAEYDDLPLDAYKAQPYFHQINTNYPGLQLIQDTPHVFVVPKFFKPEECQKVRDLCTLSSEKGSSATYEAQTKERTSTSVIYDIESEPPLLTELRERIAVLTGVGTDQLQATKISCYEKGQFFARHTDSNLYALKHPWLVRLYAGNENAEQLTAAGENDCFMPDRFCTVWIYLNDVEEGGHTCFHSSFAKDDLYETTLPLMGTVLGKASPGVPNTRSKKVNLRVKPKAGMAVIHFPTTTKEYMCVADPLALHEGEEALDPKYILQQFIWSESLETVMQMDTSTNPDRIAANRARLFGRA